VPALQRNGEVSGRQLCLALGWASDEDRLRAHLPS